MVMVATRQAVIIVFVMDARVGSVGRAARQTVGLELVDVLADARHSHVLELAASDEDRLGLKRVTGAS